MIIVGEVPGSRIGPQRVPSSMFGDTTPEAARVRWGVLARMNGEQRVRQALELTDFVLRLRVEGERWRAERDAPNDERRRPAP